MYRDPRPGAALAEPDGGQPIVPGNARQFTPDVCASDWAGSLNRPYRFWLGQPDVAARQVDHYPSCHPLTQPRWTNRTPREAAYSEPCPSSREASDTNQTQKPSSAREVPAPSFVLMTRTLLVSSPASRHWGQPALGDAAHLGYREDRRSMENAPFQLRRGHPLAGCSNESVWEV